MELKIALGQMDIAWGQPEHNLAKVAELAAKSAAAGTRLLVLPELWSTGYDLENADRYASPLGQGIFEKTAALAQEHELAIVGSCLSDLGAQRYGNTAVLFDSTGSLQASYNKIHLFNLMAEPNYLTAGENLALVDVAWGRMGMAICYDLRFPELFRAYALAGAKVIILPSEWPHPRLAHWRTLLRARAIENQLYIVGCNRVGLGGQTQFCGHSAIIDPWGETVIEGGEEEELLIGVIDLTLVDAVRGRMPVLADRRPNTYELLR